MTEIIIHDTLRQLKPILLSTTHPKERLTEARQTILHEEHGLQITLLKHHLADKARNGWDVLQCAQLEALIGQQGFGAFNPTRRVEVSAWQFERFEALDILHHLENLLTQLTAQLDMSILPRLDVYLIPADPAHRALMLLHHGLHILAGASGCLAIQLMPDESNIARLEASLVYALITNLRQVHLQMNGLLSLGDWLVMEGLAAHYVEQHFPDFAPSWALPYRQPDQWNAILSFIAQFYGLASYTDMVTNIYGEMMSVGSIRPVQPTPLDAEEMEYTLAVMQDDLAATEANRIAAYLFGDEIVSQHGHPAMGVSPYAGFKVGHHLVQAYLTQTGRTPQDCLAIPTLKILES